MYRFGHLGCGPRLMLGFGNVSDQETSNQTQASNAQVSAGEIGQGGEGNTNIITDASPLALETVKDVVNAAFSNQMNNRTADRAVFSEFAGRSDNTTQAIARLAETKITDGATVTQKTVFVALAIGGAVLVLPQLFRR